MQTRSRGALSALLVVWLFIEAFVTLRHVVAFYTPLPIRDYWSIVDHIPAYQSFHWQVLWQTHNEHRILFPEIVFAFDILFGHGRLLLPLIMSVICYVGTWLILSAAVWRDNQVEILIRWIAILFAGIVALFETSTLVLADPFLLQWTLMQVCVAAALFFLSQLKEAESASSVWGVIIASTVATYSCGNALVLWPLIIGMGLLLKLTRRSLVVLTTAAVANLALYLVGYRFSSTIDVLKLIEHPVYTFGFVSSYLGLPFSLIKAPVFGIWVGVINLFFGILLFAFAARHKLLSSKTAIVIFGYYAFTVLTAFTTAAGRSDPTDYSFGAAKAVRYIAVPQMNWASLLLMIFWASGRSVQRRILVPLCSIIFALTFLVAFIKLDRWFAVNSREMQGRKQAAISLRRGTIDRQQIAQYIYPDVDFVLKSLPLLKESKLSIYYRP